MILSIDLGGTKIQYAVLEYNPTTTVEREPKYSGLITTVATQKGFLEQLKQMDAFDEQFLAYLIRRVQI